MNHNLQCCTSKLISKRFKYPLFLFSGMTTYEGNLEADLAQFTGTEKYYRNFTGLLFTDGIKYLADHAECYWLIDLCGSYQPELKDIPFQLWRVDVRDDNSALVTMVEDIGQPIKVRQEIPFTDFPLSEFEFFCMNNVMFLKSEY